MDGRRAWARVENERCCSVVTGALARGRRSGLDQDAQHGTQRRALDHWQALEHIGDCTADRAGDSVSGARAATGTDSQRR